MPRQPRLDLPGLLYHVIARGIERREIFGDDRDRETFVDRLGELMTESDAKLYAWCLLSNHFHLVLKSGERPLAWIMRRLMTGHAVRYNLRPERSGHLFQNRYKSIVVEEEPHLLELIRYVALNPVRAGLVHSAEELDQYRWSGHGVLVGARRESWQEAEEVLARFARRRREAVARYRQYVIDGWNQGRREDLTGGGLIRSAGGAQKVGRQRPEEREAADDRILGSGEFVEAVWRAAATVGVERPRRRWDDILKEIADRFGFETARILGGSRERRVSRARREFFLRALEEGGMSMAQLARRCAMNPASVSRAIALARVEAEPEAPRLNKT
jgi:putative transposase